MYDSLFKNSKTWHLLAIVVCALTGAVAICIGVGVVLSHLRWVW